MAKPTPAPATKAAPVAPAPQAPANNTQAAVAAATGGPVRVPTLPNVPGTITVLKQGATYRGARAAWYASVCAYAGQPVNTWLAAVAAKAPSLPASGNAEPVSGWWRWLVKQGLVTNTVAPAAPQATPPAK